MQNVRKQYDSLSGDVEETETEIEEKPQDTGVRASDHEFDDEKFREDKEEDKLNFAQTIVKTDVLIGALNLKRNDNLRVFNTLLTVAYIMSAAIVAVTALEPVIIDYINTTAPNSQQLQPGITLSTKVATVMLALVSGIVTYITQQKGYAEKEKAANDTLNQGYTLFKSVEESFDNLRDVENPAELKLTREAVRTVKRSNLFTMNAQRCLESDKHKYIRMYLKDVEQHDQTMQGLVNYIRIIASHADDDDEVETQVDSEDSEEEVYELDGIV